VTDLAIMGGSGDVRDLYGATEFESALIATPRQHCAEQAEVNPLGSGYLPKMLVL
jgi:hypothetical protein